MDDSYHLGDGFYSGLPPDDDDINSSKAMEDSVPHYDADDIQQIIASCQTPPREVPWEAPRETSAASRRSPRRSQIANSRRPISPPPLRRNASSAVNKPQRSPTVTTRQSSTTHVSGLLGSGRRASGAESSSHISQKRATPSPNMRSTVKAHPAHSTSDLTVMATPQKQEWGVPELAQRLDAFRKEIRRDHAQLVAYIIDSTPPVDRRVLKGLDLFPKAAATLAEEKSADTMKIRFKQHLKNKKDQRAEDHRPICIKTNKARVPRYLFHHVAIKKNVLTPNTMLTFVPHLRDLESYEETKYNLWLKELEDTDLKSGFKPMNREEKARLAIQSERAAIVSLYLESWLERLSIPGCTKSTLIRHMARQEPDDAITPRQKNDILRSHGEGSDTPPESTQVAQMFTDAFRRVFKYGQPTLKQLELRHVLRRDESVDNIIDAKPTAKDGSSPQEENEDELAESKWLATYCILGCMICFSHSCEHGEYDMQNYKHTFSITSHRSRLTDVLKRRRLASSQGEKLVNGDAIEVDDPCNRNCYLLSLDDDHVVKTEKRWTDLERKTLRSILTTTAHSQIKMKPFCIAAAFLDRDCTSVYREYQTLNVTLAEIDAPKDQLRPKNLPWYDRHKKVLHNDWQDHTITHQHNRREVLDPCSHEGPCAPKVCTCVDGGVMCEKFCCCTAENCAYKFTGCNCHSQGKNCQAKLKDKSCICVQLNRECDPLLCGNCGVLDRADPSNAHDAWLHATGCQNCDLQRGLAKTLVLGESQLEGCGYGLFTAEDIAQDDFVVEYVGELITHDEGVRREARRGDVFNEESHVSYVFTLLENEGIWVDAAIYGNLSRYINHASEHDTHGCNITPKILYVNGEFRIKFSAIRDIKAGEELFFNYGENFPNLTKKLLDNKAGGKAQPGKRRGRKPKNMDGEDGFTSNFLSGNKNKPKRGRKSFASLADDSMSENGTKALGKLTPRQRKRKRGLQEESDEQEYQPRAAAGRSVNVASSDGEEASPAKLRGRQKVKGKKTKRRAKAKEPKPKPRGKRGGARPGSGRPRKYPRPDDKPPSGGGTTGRDGPIFAPLDEPLESVVARDPVPSVGSPTPAPPVEVAQTVTRTPKPRTMSGWLRKVVIHDSEDEDQASNKDEKGAGAGYEDEEDEDASASAKARARAQRNRRPAAKLRDSEGWRLGS